MLAFHISDRHRDVSGGHFAEQVLDMIYQAGDYLLAIESFSCACPNDAFKIGATILEHLFGSRKGNRKGNVMAHEIGNVEHKGLATIPSLSPSS